MLLLTCSLWAAGCGTDNASTADVVADESTASPRATSADEASTADVAAHEASSTPTATRADDAPVAGDQSEPILILPSLHDGDSFTLPAELAFEIQGFPGDLPAGVHIQAIVGEPSRGRVIEMQIEALQGVLLLPDDKQLSGQRDITFQLVDGTGIPFANPQSRQTFRSLLLMGRR